MVRLGGTDAGSVRAVPTRDSAGDCRAEFWVMCPLHSSSTAMEKELGKEAIKPLSRFAVRDLAGVDLGVFGIVAIGVMGTVPDHAARGGRPRYPPAHKPDGTAVCFDSTHEGTRQMYMVEVGKIVGRQ